MNSQDDLIHLMICALCAFTVRLRIFFRILFFFFGFCFDVYVCCFSRRSGSLHRYSLHCSRKKASLPVQGSCPVLSRFLPRENFTWQHGLLLYALLLTGLWMRLLCSCMCVCVYEWGESVCCYCYYCFSIFFFFAKALVFVCWKKKTICLCSVDIHDLSWYFVNAYFWWKLRGRIILCLENNCACTLGMEKKENQYKYTIQHFID